MELVTHSMLFQPADGVSPVIPMLTTIFFFNEIILPSLKDSFALWHKGIHVNFFRETPNNFHVSVRYLLASPRNLHLQNKLTLMTVLAAMNVLENNVFIYQYIV
jgi:hypothetical protein